MDKSAELARGRTTRSWTQQAGSQSDPIRACEVLELGTIGQVKAIDRQAAGRPDCARLQGAIRRGRKF